MILGAILIGAVGVANPNCGSNRQVVRLLEARLADLAAGRTLTDLKARLGDAFSEHQLSDGAGARRASFLITGRDGSRSATQHVLCDLDSASRVVRCANEGERFITQTAAEVDWERVSKGATLEQVYRTICEPGDPICLVRLRAMRPAWSTWLR